MNTYAQLLEELKNHLQVYNPGMHFLPSNNVTASETALLVYALDEIRLLKERVRELEGQSK